MRLRLLGVIIGLICCAATADAGDHQIDWGFSLGAGAAQAFLNPSEQPWALGYDLRLGCDLRLSREWRLAVQVARRQLYDDTTTTDKYKFPSPGSKSARIWSQTIFNLNARYLLWPDRRLHPYVAAAFGLSDWKIKDYSTGTVLRVPDADSGEKDYAALEIQTGFGVGAEYDLTPKLAVRGGFDFSYLTGAGASFAESVEDFRSRGNVTLSIALTAYLGSGKKPPPPVLPPVRAEEKPDTVVAVAPVEEPEEETTAAVSDSAALPLMALAGDADADGVPDSTDQCPDTPAGVPVDTTGCPTDSDGDGVIDADDQCAYTPAGAYVDSAGCPRDFDGDGIFEGLDRCPDSPEGLAVDETGCLIMTQLDRKLLLFPDFEPGWTTFDPVSRKILADLAIRLTDNTQVQVTVRAFTDDIGEAEANLELSERRADRARRFLIDRGVAPERITAIGMGEVDFIADNSTAAGRKRNRRLEFTFEW